MTSTDSTVPHCAAPALRAHVPCDVSICSTGCGQKSLPEPRVSRGGFCHDGGMSADDESVSEPEDMPDLSTATTGRASKMTSSISRRVPPTIGR